MISFHLFLLILHIFDRSKMYALTHTFDKKLLSAQASSPNIYIYIYIYGEHKFVNILASCSSPSPVTACEDGKRAVIGSAGQFASNTGKAFAVLSTYAHGAKKSQTLYSICDTVSRGSKKDAIPFFSDGLEPTYLCLTGLYCTTLGIIYK